MEYKDGKVYSGGITKGYRHPIFDNTFLVLEFKNGEFIGTIIDVVNREGRQWFFIKNPAIANSFFVDVTGSALTVELPDKKVSKVPFQEFGQAIDKAAGSLGRVIDNVFKTGEGLTGGIAFISKLVPIIALILAIIFVYYAFIQPRKA